VGAKGRTQRRAPGCGLHKPRKPTSQSGRGATVIQRVPNRRAATPASPAPSVVYPTVNVAWPDGTVSASISLAPRWSSIAVSIAAPISIGSTRS